MAQPYPEARVVPARRAFWIWLVPVFAIAAGGYLAWMWWHSQGPSILIRFQDASGLVAGKSDLIYRGAPIGKVTDIELTPDRSHAEVRVRLTGVAEQFAREGSLFWKAEPQVGLRGVSNLDTLIKGGYIKVRPGSGEPQTRFEGRSTPPMDEALAQGLAVKLLAPRLLGVTTGAPVVYRDLTVGQVTYTGLSEDQKSVVITARIQQQFAALVNSASTFWITGGVDANINLFGRSEINIASLQSLLAGGGIAFTSPSGYEPITTSYREFQLYPSEPPDKEHPWRWSVEQAPVRNAND